MKNLDKCFKIKNIPFINFTDEEMEKIRKYAEEMQIKTISFDFGNQCADILGQSVGTVIGPTGIEVVKL